MPSDINQPLLYLFWSGMATPMQLKLIDEWLAEPAHQELYYSWLQEWEEQHPQSIVDVDKAWSDLQFQLNTPHQPPSEQILEVAMPVAGWRGGAWLMAATILLVLGVGFWAWPIIRYSQYRTTYGQTQQIQLADGSRVSLQTNSELRVPRFFFDRGERTVWLKGEAAFSVRHQPNSQRFIVKTDSPLDVVVVGTEFIVASRQRQFQVALHSGNVLLRHPVGKHLQPLSMQPGDVFTYSAKGHAQLSHAQPTQELVTGQEHLFVFDHHTLPEVLALIHEQFGDVIEVEDSVRLQAPHQITGRFRAKNVDELLMVITGLTGYHIDNQGNQKRLVRSYNSINP